MFDKRGAASHRWECRVACKAAKSRSNGQSLVVVCHLVQCRAASGLTAGARKKRILLPQCNGMGEGEGRGAKYLLARWLLRLLKLSYRLLSNDASGKLKIANAAFWRFNRPQTLDTLANAPESLLRRSGASSDQLLTNIRRCCTRPTSGSMLKFPDSTGLQVREKKPGSHIARESSSYFCSRKRGEAGMLSIEPGGWIVTNWNVASNRLAGPSRL